MSSEFYFCISKNRLPWMRVFRDAFKWQRDCFSNHVKCELHGSSCFIAQKNEVRFTQSIQVYLELIFVNALRFFRFGDTISILLKQENITPVPCTALCQRFNVAGDFYHR